jgi:hypothetical protein
MKYLAILFLLFLITISETGCSEKKKRKEKKLTELEILALKDTLHQEDIDKMMAEAGGKDTIVQNYEGIVSLNNQKEYFFNSDSAKYIHFNINSSSPFIAMKVYKEITKTIVQDSTQSKKIKEMMLLDESLNYQDFSKNSEKYKIVVSQINKDPNDASLTSRYKLVIKKFK